MFSKNYFSHPCCVSYYNVITLLLVHTHFTLFCCSLTAVCPTHWTMKQDEPYIHYCLSVKRKFRKITYSWLKLLLLKMKLNLLDHKTFLNLISQWLMTNTCPVCNENISSVLLMRTTQKQKWDNSLKIFQFTTWNNRKSKRVKKCSIHYQKHSYPQSCTMSWQNKPDKND